MSWRSWIVLAVWVGVWLVLLLVAAQTEKGL